MTILICDLDLTLFAEESMIKDYIHPAQALSEPVTITKSGWPKNVRIINPCELSNLINTACTEYDGIMILTSGSWDANLRETLADHLDLSPLAASKLASCHFLSAVNCADSFPNLNLLEISHMMKNVRLAKYIELNPELKSHRFVMLDDNPAQIDCFAHSDYVTAVYATTDTEDKCFYQTTLNALENAQLKSLQKIATVTQSVEVVKTINHSPTLFLKRNLEKAGIEMDEADKQKSKRPRLDLRNDETLNGL